jgi:hypothetical protein
MSDSPPAHEHLETAEHLAHGVKGGITSGLIPLSIAIMAVVASAFGSSRLTQPQPPCWPAAMHESARVKRPVSGATFRRPA